MSLINPSLEWAVEVFEDDGTLVRTIDCDTERVATDWVALSKVQGTSLEGQNTRVVHRFVTRSNWKAAEPGFPLDLLPPRETEAQVKARENAQDLDLLWHYIRGVMIGFGMIEEMVDTVLSELRQGWANDHAETRRLGGTA